MTERKRASGFVLMDAAFTADAKFVRLARLTTPVEFAACVGVWWMLLADCRRGKSPDVDWDDYTEYAEQIDRLRTAKLLNEGGFDPESFSRWAPAYRSVSERTRGTEGNGEVRSGTESTESTLTSGQVISGQVLPTDGTRAREAFMGFKPKPGLHDGSHPDCRVCEPLRKTA
jgi:hypothetical protein